MGSCCKDQDKTLKKWKKMTPRSSTSQLKLTVEPCPVILGIIRGIRDTSKNNKYWAKKYILTGIKDIGWKRPDIKTIKNKAFFTYV